MTFAPAGVRGFDSALHPVRNRAVAGWLARTKRANGAGTVYIKNGSYCGRWITVVGRLRHGRKVNELAGLKVIQRRRIASSKTVCSVLPSWRW